jgi:thymidylate synthase (FAD)
VRVQLIGITQFMRPEGVPWQADATGASALVEFAGRACYQSWNKPNPATATNEGYIGHILEVGHFSVLEHSQFTFYIEGVSRALTHELIRHRHLSYSQLSQRYVKDAAEVVEPDVIAEDEETHEAFENAVVVAQEAYHDLVRMLELKYENVSERTLRRKLARQAARSVLPNATETKIVVTGNARAWRHFLHLRGNMHADLEIRELAVQIAFQLVHCQPNLFQDVEPYGDTDGLTSIKVGNPEEG